MGIKITLQQLLDSKPALEKIAKQDIDIVQSFKLARVIRELNDHFKDYDEQRIALIKKLGTEDKDGNFEVKGDAKEEFVNEMEKLFGIEVDLSFEPFKLSEFKGIKISPGDALGLEVIFDLNN